MPITLAVRKVAQLRWINRLAFAVRNTVDLRERNFAHKAVELNDPQMQSTIYLSRFHLVD